MKHLGLLKYATLTSGQLTAPIVAEIAQGLGINADVTDETMESITSILKSGDVNTLADLLGSPTIFPKIKDLLIASAAPEDDNLIICPHCQEYINPQV